MANNNMNITTVTNTNSSRIDTSNDKQINVEEVVSSRIINSFSSSSSKVVEKGSVTTIPRHKSKSTATKSNIKIKVKKRGSTSKLSSTKDKPKRALSAYNIFFKHTRSRIVVGLSEQGTKEETITAMEEIIANSTIRKPPNSRKYR